MINIAITAGGTSENIDGIRKITNVSTGSLGWHCLEAVLEFMQKQERQDFHVYYVLTETAVYKQLTETEKNFVDFIHVSDAESVYLAIDKLTKEVKIDYFIHSMAISDFTFSYTVTMYDLADEICQAAAENRKILENQVVDILQNPVYAHQTGKKISSDDDIIMGLKRTKKVIPLIKKNNPETFLIGFKLLRNVNEEELMHEAKKLTNKNDCDMVFANEVSRISEDNHHGVLIYNNIIIDRPSGKINIAVSIIHNMFAYNINIHSK